MPLCECGCKTPIQPTKSKNYLRRKGEYARFISGHQSRVRSASGKDWHEPWYFAARKSD